MPDITYQFRSRRPTSNPNTFLYNTGPITSLTDPNWNRRQFVHGVQGRRRRGADVRSGPNLACPPCNIGPASTPNYAALADGGDPHARPPARRSSPASGPRVSTSTSARSSTSASCGRSSRDTWPRCRRRRASTRTLAKNIHTIAIQVPKTDLTRAASRRPTSRPDQRDDRRVRHRQPARRDARCYQRRRAPSDQQPGAFVQVSRLGNPLVNEVHHPDRQEGQVQLPEPGRRQAVRDATSTTPSWPACCPCSTRACSPTWPKLTPGRNARADLDAILLTGIPAGVVPGFQNVTGSERKGRHAAAEHGRPAHRRPSRATSASSAATWPASRTVAGCSTTSPRSSCGRIAGATCPLVDPSLHRRRRRRCDHARADVEQHRRDRREHRALPRGLPLPRHAARRLPQPGQQRRRPRISVRRTRPPDHGPGRARRRPVSARAGRA